jgi:membrane-bound lytic murein transglycosylase MltF
VRDDIVFRSGARLAWAFRKDSPKLESVLNKFAKKNRQGTLIGNVLSNRDLRDFDWADNALGKDHFQRFGNLSHIFKRYGEQYEVNYLIAAAQGYQESRLDQSVRSSAGAVGVMQLLPTTAAGKSVAIKDVHKVEPNIHAGIKYLNYLRERYFSDLADDPLNQTFLALAAYNAGPTRMINMRNKAEKLGYDRNVWFDNVEIVAARDIGAETVQYVANIYKYYLAYELTIEQEANRAAARERAGI